MRKKIGECLIQAGLITEDDLRDALVEHKRTGDRVGVVLVRMNLATEKQIAKALAFQLGFPYVNLVENPPDPAAVVLIPKEVSIKRVCVAVGLEKNARTSVGYGHAAKPSCRSRCERQQSRITGPALLYLRWRKSERVQALAARVRDNELTRAGGIRKHQPRPIR